MFSKRTEDRSIEKIQNLLAAHNPDQELHFYVKDYCDASASPQEIEHIFYQLFHTIGSASTPLHIHFSGYPDAEKAAMCLGMVEALKYNTNINILLGSDEDKWVVNVVSLLNKRNELLKQYPQFRENILLFCRFFAYENEYSGRILYLKKDFPDKINQFFHEVTVFNEQEILMQEDMDALVERAEKPKDEETESAFLLLPFDKLMKNDLIVRLYQSAGNNNFRNKILELMLANKESIKKSQPVSIIALLIANEKDSLADENMDNIFLQLMVCYFSNKSEETWIKTFESLDTEQINLTHLILAEKISPTIHKILAQKFYSNPFNDPEKITRISFLQNAIRLKNRTQILYPSLFKLPADSRNSSYSFWNDKPREKISSLQEKLRIISLDYIHAREKKLASGHALNFIHQYTFQYISSASAIHNIMNIGYFLSQGARERLGMYFFSNNDFEDIVTADNSLVCTAPLSVMPGIARNAEAMITIDLTQIPYLKLQNCVIKMSDYFRRRSALPEIAVTPSIQMQVLPYQLSPCTLIRMKSNPSLESFENLPLEPEVNAYILFEDKLFYAERRNNTLIPIRVPQGREADFFDLHKKFQVQPTRMHQDDSLLFSTLTGIRQQDRSITQYHFSSQDASFTLTIPGTNELFHGLNGFTEATCHFLFIINSLPDYGDGKKIKDELIAYLDERQAEGNLHGYMDWVFNQLFQFMEIDFPYGLPMSIDYVHSIKFMGTNQSDTIEFNKIKTLAQKGTLGDYEPELMQIPTILLQTLKAVSPEYFPAMVTAFKEKYPRSLILAMHGWQELLKKNVQELKDCASLLPYKKDNLYDMSALLAAFKNNLAVAGNSEKCQLLIEKQQANLIVLRDKLKILYQNFTFAGGESKLREIFLNADIMHLLNHNNGELIAAILALEIQSEKNPDSCMDSVVHKVISQRTHKEIKITLSSILSNILEQPVQFLEAYPINLPPKPIFNMDTHIKTILLDYIQQRILFKYHYNILEKCLIALCNSMPNFSLGDYALKIPEKNQIQWEKYAAFIQDISFIDEDFCRNKNIIDEINHILPFIVEFTCGAQQPTLEQLVNNILHSTALLDPGIAHLLFDSTHFPIALKGAGINQIALADQQSISFHQLIIACVEKLAKTGVDTSSALMAEQLFLRITKLQVDFKIADEPIVNSQKNTNP